MSQSISQSTTAPSSLEGHTRRIIPRNIPKGPFVGLGEVYVKDHKHQKCAKGPKQRGMFGGGMAPHCTWKSKMLEPGLAWIWDTQLVGRGRSVPKWNEAATTQMVLNKQIYLNLPPVNETKPSPNKPNRNQFYVCWGELKKVWRFRWRFLLQTERADHCQDSPLSSCLAKMLCFSSPVLNLVLRTITNHCQLWNLYESAKSQHKCALASAKEVNSAASTDSCNTYALMNKTPQEPPVTFGSIKLIMQMQLNPVWSETSIFSDWE